MARIREFNEEQALEKARNIFWQKGYTATSMKDLVDGLGISRSSMYETFGDKEALFYKSLEAYKKEQSAFMFEKFEQVESPLQAISNMFTFIINDSVADKERKGCFMVNSTVELSPSNKQVNTLTCDNTAQMEKTFAHWLEIGQQKGEINKKHTPKQQAKFVFNAIVGMRVAAKNGTDKKSLSDIAALTLSAIVK